MLFQLQQGRIYDEALSFSTKIWVFLEFPCIFKEVNTKREIQTASWKKRL